jgi:hypothetical protein
MILHPPTISSKHFTYHATSRTFSAEASDLGPALRLGPVYDDACDEGFTLVSDKTGDLVVFALEREVRDGDLRYTEFVSVTPRYRGYSVRVFND